MSQQVYSSHLQRFQQSGVRVSRITRIIRIIRLEDQRTNRTTTQVFKIGQKVTRGRYSPESKQREVLTPLVLERA